MKNFGRGKLLLIFVSVRLVRQRHTAQSELSTLKQMRCTPDLPNGAQARAGEEFCGQGKATTDILQTTHHNCTSPPEEYTLQWPRAPRARAGEEVLRSRKAPRIFYARRTATALLRLRLHTTMTKSWPDSNDDAHLPWVVVGVRKSIMQSSFPMR
ncbi:MAG: hypothetical protein Q9161_007299 [Pseudevernia consocians]